MQNSEVKSATAQETEGNDNEDAVLQNLQSNVIISPGKKDNNCLNVTNPSTDLIRVNTFETEGNCNANEKFENAITKSSDDVEKMEIVFENKCQKKETIFSVNLTSENSNQSKKSEISGTKNKIYLNSEAEIGDIFKENGKVTDLPFPKTEIGKQNESKRVSCVKSIKANMDIKEKSMPSDDNGTFTKNCKKLIRSQTNKNVCEITENKKSLDENISDKKEIVAKKKGVSQTEIPKKKNVKSKNFFDIGIPLIGKAIFHKEEKPFAKRYDLAIEMNKRRFRSMQQKSWKNGAAGLAAWEIEANQIFKDKNKSAHRKKFENLNMAQNLTKINLKLLKELSCDSIRERRVKHYLLKLSKAHVTPTALLYVPHVVHTVSLCRGNQSFSKGLRLMADDCYGRYHAMFPVPMGYNFETVYTSEVGKFLQDPFNKIEDIPLNYGDMSDIFSDSENDSDKESAS